MNLAVFDIDGTLTDSFSFDRYFFAAVRAVAGPCEGIEDPSNWSDLTDESIARLGTDRIDEVKAHYAASLEDHDIDVQAIPGAQKILDTLRAHDGWRVAIATGNWHAGAVCKLRSGGIEFDGIPIVGADGRMRRTEILRDARAASGEGFQRVVYIGDTHWDAAACRELQWPFVGRGDGADGASHTLQHFEDHEEVFEALHGAEVPA